MSTDVGEQKALLRERIRAKNRALTTISRTSASEQVCSRLRGLSAWGVAKIILLYMPLADEVDIRPLVQESLLSGKVVAFPRFEPRHQSYVACGVVDLGNDLVIGQFGIMEPRNDCPVVPLNRLDFAVVPGVAFTLHGRRLGRGKGYYDRLLASVSGTKCGVGLDEQVVESIPVEAHDVQLDWIVTPTRSVRASEWTSRF